MVSTFAFDTVDSGANSDEDEAKTEKEDLKINYFQVTKRILLLNRSEWFSMIVATLSAFFIGASFPIFAILFAEFYGVCQRFI